MFSTDLDEAPGYSWRENKLHLPMLLHMDNTGAIYLSNNQAVGSRTKHIFIRTHYVRNLINEEIIKTLFVK
jgi:hypothetical protein